MAGDAHFDPALRAESFSEGDAHQIMQPVIRSASEKADWLASYKNRVKGVPKPESYRETYELMKPELELLLQLKQFVDSIQTLFLQNMQAIGNSKRLSPDQHTSLVVMVKALDIMVVINYLKMYNTSILNDFAMFRRSFQHVREAVGPAESDRMSECSTILHFFLANPNSVIDDLKERVSQMQSPLFPLRKILSLCAKSLAQKGLDMPAAERGMLLRVLVYTVFLIDGENYDAYSDRVVRSCRGVIRKYPEIHIYGELKSKSLVVLRSTPNWDSEVEEYFLAPASFVSNRLPNTCVLL